MDRDEFIRQLRIALSGSVNHIIIEDNVRYYEDYIDMEVRKGRTEYEVLQELGNPRLIAKTIIETNKIAGTSQSAYEEEAYDDAQAETNRGFRGGNRTFRLPLWLAGIVIFLIVMVFFTLLTTVMAAVLPYLLPIILIIAAARLIRTLWR
ncbi:MAG: DUF1700 domain-containing protein [Lachnospiraceae bacterium]|nr:DUF1700 domain-containing protein [Lachnospiraceae bacterium]